MWYFVLHRLNDRPIRSEKNINKRTCTKKKIFFVSICTVKFVVCLVCLIMDKEKRARASKYSVEELDILLKYLENSPELILGEMGSKGEVSSEWENIATFVNSCGMGIERTGEQIRAKWTDLKYRVKKKASTIHHSLIKTGGGPPSKLKLTDLEERVLNLIGSKCVRGITNLDYDSSSFVNVSIICHIINPI